MDIGVALWTMQSTASAPASLPRLYARLREDATHVEALGFHSLWFAEHRFWYDGWCPAPMVAAAAVAAGTTRLRLATGMLLLPQRDPVRLARTVATLDHLSGGRVDLGVGLGHRDAEFDGLGISRAHRGARMDEALDVVLGLWKGEAYHHEGTHFTVQDQSLTTLPVQQPHPPIWIGGMADPAISRGVRRGLSFLLPQTLYPDEIRAFIDRIHTEAGSLGIAPGRVGILKDAWVGSDGDAARERMLPRIATHYREEAGSWWVLKGAQHGFDAPEQLDRQLRRITQTPLIGDPDEVRTQLEELRDTGVDLVTLRFNFDVTRSESTNAAQQFAEHVLPAFTTVGAR